MDWEFTDIDPTALRGSLLIVGIPVVRNVAPIVTSLIIGHPARKLAALVLSDGLPPVSMAYEGVVSGPVQVWTIPGACGPAGACANLAVLNSDVRVPPEHLMAFCGALSSWASKHGVRLAVALEGADAAEFGHDVRFATSPQAEGQLSTLRLAPHHGIHAGFNAAFLARASGANVPAVGLFAPSAGGQAMDATAAAQLLGALEPWLPRDVREAKLANKTVEMAKTISQLRGERESAQKMLSSDFTMSYA